MRVSAEEVASEQQDQELSPEDLQRREDIRNTVLEAIDSILYDVAIIEGKLEYVLAVPEQFDLNPKDFTELAKRMERVRSAITQHVQWGTKTYQEENEDYENEDYEEPDGVMM